MSDPFGLLDQGELLVLEGLVGLLGDPVDDVGRERPESRGAGVAQVELDEQVVLAVPTVHDAHVLDLGQGLESARDRSDLLGGVAERFENADLDLSGDVQVLLACCTFWHDAFPSVERIGFLHYTPPRVILTTLAIIVIILNMSMSNFEEEHHPDMADLNEFAAKLSEAKAQELRTDAMSLAYHAFSGLLARQAVPNREPGDSKGDDPSFFLELDLLASPGLSQTELKDALSYTLVRTKERAPGDTFGADRIHVYLPVSRDFHLGKNPSELPEFEEIEEVYVLFEKDKPDGTHTQRYVITKEEVYEYAVLIDPDYDADTSDILGREMHYFATDTQRLHMLMVAQLIEDHRNFKIKRHPTDE